MRTTSGQPSKSIELGTIEGYTIFHDREGLHIASRDCYIWIVMFVMSLGLLAEIWVYATYSADGLGEVGWCWTAAILFFGMASFFGMFYTEDWTITDREFRSRNSFRRWERCYLRPRGKRLHLRLETIIPRTSDDFPRHVVHVIGSNGDDIGEVFQFQTREHVAQFLEAIRQVVPLHVDGAEPGRNGE
jgi:hypothetical protein